MEVTVGMPPVSAPEPDIALTSAAKGEGYVPLESVALAIEVADSTAAFDLGQKAQLYAKHQIPEYWVIELPAGTIHQFWSPGEAGYLERRQVRIGASLNSITLADLVVETEGLI